MARSNPKDSIHFVGPEHFSAGDIPGETAREAQPLGFGQIGLASPQSGFGPLVILDISRCPIPLDDVSVLVAPRQGAQQDPAIFAVGPPQACFLVEGCTSRAGRAPLLLEPLAFVGMNSIQPAPTQSRIRGETAIFPKTLIYEIGGAVRQFSPDYRGDCVDDEPKLLFGLPDSRIRLGVPSLQRDGRFVCGNSEQQPLCGGRKVRSARAHDDDRVVAKTDRRGNDTKDALPDRIGDCEHLLG